MLLPEIPRLDLVTPPPDPLPVTLCLSLGIEESVGVTAAQVLAVGVGKAHADQFEVYIAATGIDLSHGSSVLVDGLRA